MTVCEHVEPLYRLKIDTMCYMFVTDVPMPICILLSVVSCNKLIEVLRIAKKRVTGTLVQGDRRSLNLSQIEKAHATSC